jgi:hypothetical protein
MSIEQPVYFSVCPTAEICGDSVIVILGKNDRRVFRGRMVVRASRIRWREEAMNVRDRTAAVLLATHRV